MTYIEGRLIGAREWVAIAPSPEADANLVEVLNLAEILQVGGGQNIGVAD